jgi:hypothetical protein
VPVGSPPIAAMAISGLWSADETEAKVELPRSVAESILEAMNEA